MSWESNPTQICSTASSTHAPQLWGIAGSPAQQKAWQKTLSNSGAHPVTCPTRGDCKAQNATLPEHKSQPVVMLRCRAQPSDTSDCRTMTANPPLKPQSTDIGSIQLVTWEQALLLPSLYQLPVQSPKLSC